MLLLGKFSKKHGLSGMIILVAEQALDDALENLTELVVLIEGLFVPFPVTEFTLRGDSSAQVKLEFVNSPEEASELIGCDVYADIACREPEPGLAQWTGFAVHDAHHGNIGVIANVEDYHGNIVLQVMQGNREILLPLYHGLITEIDEENQLLHINAPEGIIE
jgi:16S rRNA processing protein RimM